MLKVGRKPAHHFLGEVVMHVAARTRQTCNERPYLGLCLGLDRRTNQLEGGRPAFGTFAEVDENVRLERALVRLAEQALRFGLVEAEVFCGQSRDLGAVSIATEWELRVSARREEDRHAVRD